MTMSSVFYELFKIFWNSSNGTYDNLSSLGISLGSVSGIPGVDSSRARPIGVSLCRYQPFLVGASI